MKKRMVVLLLVMIMISGLCVNAMATGSVKSYAQNCLQAPAE